MSDGVEALVRVETMLQPVRQALRILLWQAGWMMVSTLAMWLALDMRWALSMFAGSAIGLLANSYVLFVMIKHTLMVTKPATLFSVLLTWLIKTILIVGLLMMAFRSPALLPLAVILGLCGSLLAYWLSMIVGRVKHANGNDGK